MLPRIIERLRNAADVVIGALALRESEARAEAGDDVCQTGLFVWHLA